MSLINRCLAIISIGILLILWFTDNQRKEYVDNEIMSSCFDLTWIDDTNRSSKTQRSRATQKIARLLKHCQCSVMYFSNYVPLSLNTEVALISLYAHLFSSPLTLIVSIPFDWTGKQYSPWFYTSKQIICVQHNTYTLNETIHIQTQVDTL